jgi:hypothetical protein
MMDSTTILLLPPTSTTLRYGDDPINMDGGWRLDADGGCVGGVGVFSDDDAARRNDVVRDGGKRCLAVLAMAKVAKMAGRIWGE